MPTAHIIKSATSAKDRTVANLKDGASGAVDRRIAKKMLRAAKAAALARGLDASVVESPLFEVAILAFGPIALMLSSSAVPGLGGDKPQGIVDAAQRGGASVLSEDFAEVVEDFIGPVWSSVLEVAAAATATKT